MKSDNHRGLSHVFQISSEKNILGASEDEEKQVVQVKDNWIKVKF